MRRSSPNRIRRTSPLALVALTLIAGCAVEPPVAAESSHAIWTADELIGVPNLNEELADEPAASDAPPPVETVPRLEEPEEEHTEEVVDYPTEGDDPMEADDPSEQPATVIGGTSAADLEQFLIDSDALPSPWQHSDGPLFSEGYEYTDNNECLPAVRVNNISAYDNVLTIWDFGDSSIQAAAGVFALPSAPDADSLISDIETLHETCPVFDAGGSQSYVFDLPVDDEQVAATSVATRDGGEYWLAAISTGRFVVVVALSDYSDSGNLQDSSLYDFNLLVGELVRVTSQNTVAPTLVDAMMTADDFGPGWEVRPEALTILDSPEDFDLCGEDGILSLVDTVEFNSSIENNDLGVFAGQLVSLFETAELAQNAILSIALMGPCDGESPREGMSIEAVQLSFPGIDEALSVMADDGRDVGRYVLLRNGRVVSALWLPEHESLSDRRVADLAVIASNRLLEAAS